MGQAAMAKRSNWHTRPGRRPHGSDPLFAVVLDAKVRQSLTAVRSLGRNGALIGAVECFPGRAVPTFWSRRCAASARVPDPSNPEHFVDALVKLLDERPARVLLVSADGSADAISARRAELERRVAVALAPTTSLDLAFDKARTLELAAGIGVAVPRLVRVSYASAVEAAVDEIGLPAVIKPTRSWLRGRHGARRVTVRSASTRSDVVAACRDVLDDGGEVLLQEFATGRRESMTLLCVRGTIVAEFAHVTHRSSPGLGGDGIVRESIRVPDDIGSNARNLIDAMELEGYSEIEFRRDSAGRPLLMEINPRLSASLELAVRAGVDFPALIARWALGEQVDVQRGYRVGQRLRWLGGDLAWLFSALGPQAAEQLDAISGKTAVNTFVRDFARRSAYDFVDREDLMPMGVAAGAMLARQMRSTAARIVHPGIRASGRDRR